VNSPSPPALATWLLQTFAGNEALVGDLVEQFRLGRSAAWFWRQTFGALLLPKASAALALAGLVAVFAIGRRVSIPGVNAFRLRTLATGTGGSFRVYDIMSGGGLGPVSVLALAIHPYVTSATVVELVAALCAIGRPAYRPTPRRIVQWTRGLAILIAVIQALGLTLFLERQNLDGTLLVSDPGWSFRISAVGLLTLGSGLLMWVSDRLTAARVGNGLLMVFTAGLLVGLASGHGVAPALLPVLAANVIIAALTARAYRRDLCAFGR